MRVLVCGGRDFSDKVYLYKTLDNYHKIFQFTTLIEGDQRGADRMAGYWARKNKVDNLKFRADWLKYSKAAGPIRNQQMLDEGKPDLVLAFDTGGPGTKNMLELTRKEEIDYIVFPV